MKDNRLIIATRKSRLALWQSHFVMHELMQAWPGLEVELLPLSTRGDEVLDQPLTTIGGKGLFLKELERALLDGRADIAVHSLKDVPAESPEGLMLGAVLPRADAEDVWISRHGLSIGQLASGSRVGSSSLRRMSQLCAVRKDLELVGLRGNVETRLKAVASGQVDATILAAAGLRRLDIEPENAIELPLEEWLPAPGQGVITVQCRASDSAVTERIRAIHCSHTAAVVAAERAVVERLGGDCRMPLAALAVLRENQLRLKARLGSTSGLLIDCDETDTIDNAKSLGSRVADQLLAKGGQQLLAID